MSSISDRLVPSAEYAPGNLLALAGETTWVLADAQIDSSISIDLIAAHGGTFGPIDILEVIARGGIATSPDFAIVHTSGTACLVIVRGTATVKVMTGDAGRVLGSEGAQTWTEHRLDEFPDHLKMEIGASTTERTLPFRQGVVQATLLSLQMVRAEPEYLPEMHASPTRAASTAPLGTADSEASREAEPYPELDSEVVVVSKVVESDPGITLGYAGLTASQAPTTDSVEADDKPEAPETTYDELFGRTIHRSVEEAAVRELADGEDEPLRAAEPLSSSSPPQAQVALSTEAPQPAPASPTVGERSHPKVAPPPPAGPDLIDQVPWSSGIPDPPMSIEPSTLEPDEVDFTIDRRAHAALLEQLSATDAPANPQHLVHAVMCTNRHPNSVHSERCRTCGLHLSDQEPVTIPRPVLGVLQMSTGDVVMLDRGVVMGRSPSSDRLSNGETAHVVKLASPSKDISRNHLEVCLDGWHVLVTDLQSKNGTVVTLPGASPHRLRPDEPTVIEPGTRVEMADDSYFVYETSSPRP
jgi:FHA domain-containing protein